MDSENRPSPTQPEHPLPTVPFAYPFPDSPLDSALAVSDELSAALALHGITLPSLGPEPASCTTSTVHRPLLELGRVNLSTAHRLTAVLTDAADGRKATTRTTSGTGTDR